VKPPKLLGDDNNCLLTLVHVREGRREGSVEEFEGKRRVMLTKDECCNPVSNNVAPYGKVDEWGLVRERFLKCWQRFGPASR